MTNDRDFNTQQLTLAVVAGDPHALYNLIAQQIKTQADMGKRVAFFHPDNFIADGQIFVDAGAAMLEYDSRKDSKLLEYSLRGYSFDYLIAVLTPEHAQDTGLTDQIRRSVFTAFGIVITYIVGK